MPGENAGDAFAAGVGPWRVGLGQVRDAVRQELVARELAVHLHASGVEGPGSVLDVGCGQGTQAIRLARGGFEVTAVDLSDELLDLARKATDLEPSAVRARIRFERGDLLALPMQYRQRFDVVCCHGVLMYLPSLGDGLAALVAAGRSGAVISVLTRNRAGIAMRAGMSGDWEEARAGFEARYYRNRLGIDNVRADEPDEVAGALHAAGAERVAWYGVRLFCDHWGSQDPPGEFDALIAAEQEAGRRDPYRQVAALTHTIAVRR